MDGLGAGVVAQGDLCVDVAGAGDAGVGGEAQQGDRRAQDRPGVAIARRSTA